MRALLNTEMNPVAANKLYEKALASQKKNIKNNPKRRAKLKEAHPGSRNRYIYDWELYRMDEKNRKARSRKKALARIALQNGGLLNPQLEDSVAMPVPKGDAPVFLPEAPKVAYAEYVTNSKGVYFSDGYSDEYFGELQNWKEYQTEEALIQSEDLEEELISGWDDESEENNGDEIAEIFAEAADVCSGTCQVETLSNMDSGYDTDNLDEDFMPPVQEITIARIGRGWVQPTG